MVDAASEGRSDPSKGSVEAVAANASEMIGGAHPAAEVLASANCSPCRSLRYSSSWRASRDADGGVGPSASAVAPAPIVCAWGEGQMPRAVNNRSSAAAFPPDRLAAASGEVQIPSALSSR